MISTCKQQHRVTFSRCKRVWTGLFSTRSLWYNASFGNKLKYTLYKYKRHVFVLTAVNIDMQNFLQE